eukprot:CFRG1082T1
MGADEEYEVRREQRRIEREKRRQKRTALVDDSKENTVQKKEGNSQCMHVNEENDQSSTNVVGNTIQVNSLTENSNNTFDSTKLYEEGIKCDKIEEGTVPGVVQEEIAKCVTMGIDFAKDISPSEVKNINKVTGIFDISKKDASDTRLPDTLVSVRSTGIEEDSSPPPLRKELKENQDIVAENENDELPEEEVGHKVIVSDTVVDQAKVIMSDLATILRARNQANGEVEEEEEKQTVRQAETDTSKPALLQTHRKVAGPQRRNRMINGNVVRAQKQNQEAHVERTKNEATSIANTGSRSEDRLPSFALKSRLNESKQVDTHSMENEPVSIQEQLIKQRIRLGQKDARLGLLAAVGAPNFKLRPRSSAIRLPMLIRCVGSSQMVVETVATSLNHEEVFVFDDTTCVYVFVGKNCSRITKSKAIELATNIRDREYHSRVSTVIVEDEESIEVDKHFWQGLNGSPNDVSTTNALSEKDVWDSTALYLWSNDKWEKSGEGKLDKRVLEKDHTRSVIVECVNEVYIWNGKLSSETTRQNAEAYAKTLLSKKPSWVAIVFVVDSGEREVFKGKFSNFNGGMDISVKANGNIKYEKTIYQTGADVVGTRTVTAEEMLSRLLVDSLPVDDGSGTVRIWHCTEKSRTELKPAEFGHFYNRDSYVVLYQRVDKNDVYVTYFWQGADARPNEKGAAAMFTMELQGKHGATQIPVMEGKECSHFLSIFAHTSAKHMVVHTGTRPVANGKSFPISENDSIRAYRLTKRGCVIRAHQQEELKLLSCGVYVVVGRTRNTFVWRGKASQPNLYAAGQHIVAHMFPEATVIEQNEGHESKEFRLLVGSAVDSIVPATVYRDAPTAAGFGDDSKRGWKVDNASGEPRAHEIPHVTQIDLLDTDCVVIDAYTAVYVWVGANARHIDMTQSVRVAKELCDIVKDQKARTSYGVQFKAQLVTADNVPDAFMALFPRWKARYLSMGTRTETEVDFRADVRRLTLSVDIYGSYDELFKKKTYSIEELKQGLNELPAGVDPALKEDYLNDADFHTVFGISRAEYINMPKWRRIALKKNTPLF